MGTPHEDTELRNADGDNCCECGEVMLAMFGNGPVRFEDGFAHEQCALDAEAFDADAYFAKFEEA